MPTTSAQKIIYIQRELALHIEPAAIPTLPPIPAIKAPAKWDEDTTLKTSAGNTRNRFGTSTQACKILDNCDRKTLHVVLRTGLIYAYQMSEKTNSRWRIDLVGCMLFRENRRRRANGLPPSETWLAYCAWMKNLNEGNTSGAPIINMEKGISSP